MLVYTGALIYFDLSYTCTELIISWHISFGVRDIRNFVCMTPNLKDYFMNIGGTIL